MKICKMFYGVIAGTTAEFAFSTEYFHPQQAPLGHLFRPSLTIPDLQFLLCLSRVTSDYGCVAAVTAGPKRRPSTAPHGDSSTSSFRCPGARVSRPSSNTRILGLGKTEQTRLVFHLQSLIQHWPVQSSLPNAPILVPL